MSVYSVGPYLYSDELCHHGILGMKWGIRRSPEELGHYSDKQIDKIARKDARRYAEAKMYYGEGAGNRRKLLKAELDRKKKDPRYAKRFEEYAANENYASAANKAKFERGARDTGKKVKRVAKAVGGVAVVAAGIYYAANKDKVDRVVNNAINTGIDKVKSWKRSSDEAASRKFVDDMFRRNAENLNRWGNLR